MQICARPSIAHVHCLRYLIKGQLNLLVYHRRKSLAYDVTCAYIQTDDKVIRRAPEP